MKKITYLTAAALVFTLASCQKNRTCSCTYFNSASGKGHTEITTYNDVSKRTALASCNSGTSYNINEPYDVETRTCELK